jgi:hypothetical protein
LADDRRPRTHAPARDEPVAHVGIGPRERFGRRRRVGAKQENRAIDRFRKRTREHDFASLVCLPGERKMLVAELRPPLEVIGREVVLEEVVFHGGSSCEDRRKVLESAPIRDRDTGG